MHKRTIELFVLVALAALLLQCGCQRSQPASKVAPEPEPEPIAVQNGDASTDEPSVEVEPNEAPESNSMDDAETVVAAADLPLDETASESTPDMESPDSDGIASEGGPTEDPVAEVPLERMVLLASGGPLVIDARVRINGESYQASLDRLVDQALLAADDDQDGTPTWEEVANSERFQYGQFGNLEVNSDEARTQLIRMYDRDPRDGIVDRGELPRFLTRNAGNARVFSLKNSNEYNGANRSKSPIRRLLDVDRNGAITVEEMETAPKRLLSFDFNDDQILTLAEISVDQFQMPQRLSNRRRRDEPDTAFLIDAKTNWEVLDYALSELYGYGSAVGPGDWPAMPELFTRLDVNQDELLSADEISALAEVPAHALLDVAFGSLEQSEGTEGTEGTEETEDTDRLTIDLVKLSAEIESAVLAVQRHPQRLSIVFQDVAVEFFVNEDAALGNSKQVSEAQLARLDTDKNGYVDEEEVPENQLVLGVPFAAIDLDDNEKIYSEELAAFLELRQAAYRGQVRARAADQRDAVFTALDADGDGRLNAREIHRSPHKLATMDRNNDGRLQSHEFPASMVVGFVRGNPQSDDALFTVPTTGDRASIEAAPRWFRGMDANADFEISAREFIGESSRFTEFDADGDGFISVQEVAD